MNYSLLEFLAMSSDQEVLMKSILIAGLLVFGISAQAVEVRDSAVRNHEGCIYMGKLGGGWWCPF